MTKQPVKFKPYCPKCKSTHIDVVSVRSWGPPDQCMTCHTCGTQKYGIANLNAMFQAQEAEWEAAQEALREQQRLAEEAALAAEAKKLQSIVPIVGMPAEGKCAWGPCTEHRTQTSKYCSRSCSNKNAHARESAKKLSLRRSA